jgi:hypothetical protein
MDSAGEAFGDHRAWANGIEPGRLWSLWEMFEVNSVGYPSCWQGLAECKASPAAWASQERPQT